MTSYPSNIIDEREKLDRRHHAHFIWTRFAMIFLGLWLLVSPDTFGYTTWNMSISDWISGLLLIIFGALSMSYRLKSWIWGGCLIGVWLQFAPLLFWAPQPVMYLNDTLIGILAISLVILVPFRHHDLELGPEVPPGWTYNPSSWQQRIPIILFGLIGWFVARYLSAYQLGYTGYVWDPFFGDGTREVITSKLSQSFPISDAGLGALAYSLEALMGAKGGSKRWHTMPWIVVIFGILVVPLGFVSILLVISQPVIVGAWCGLCLIIALCMLIMLALTVDEVIAVLQYLKQSTREGKPFWRTFWLGSRYTENTIDARSPGFLTTPSRIIKSMVWGITVPWNLALSALLGIWTMFSNRGFGMTGDAADNSDIFGAIIVTISIITWAEVVRTGRFINIILGLWLVIAAWTLPGTTDAGQWNSLIVGILVILLAIPRGKIKEHYGDWDKAIK